MSCDKTDKSIREELPYQMSFMSFSWFWPLSFPGCHIYQPPPDTHTHPPFFFLAPSVLMLAGTSNSPLTVCSSTHINTHTHTYSCTSSFRGTLQHSRSPSPVCQHLTQNILRAAIVLLHQQPGAEAGKLCSQPPPPTEPAHRSVTTPGERRPHSTNSERKCFDSFINYIYGFLPSGSSSSWTELISLHFLFLFFFFFSSCDIQLPF